MRKPAAWKWWCRTSQLSLAIGRRGQNVRLASQLTRWDIDILTEAEECERRQEEFRRKHRPVRRGAGRGRRDRRPAGARRLRDDRGPGRHARWTRSPRSRVRRERRRRAGAPRLTFLERQAAEQEEKRVALGVTDEIAAIEVLLRART